MAVVVSEIEIAGGIDAVSVFGSVTGGTAS
jgi:hypothetical protein